MVQVSEQKKAAIKDALRLTKLRRQTQICKVYELKLDKSRFSKTTLQQLQRLFVEAKWFRNAILASENLWMFDTKTKQVQVKVDQEFQTRPLTVLGSQLKQSIHDQIKSELCGLSTKKKQGHKVGALKFKSWVGSVNLKQHGTTYTLSSNGRLRIQNIKQRLRTRGIDQIPQGAEFANAKLLSRHGDFYLHVTCYLTAQQLQAHHHKKPKKNPKPAPQQVESLGLDVGIAHQLTTSNGIHVQYRVPISPQIRKAHQKVSRTQKHSNHRRKARQRLQKAYAKTTNIKQNLVNQLVACLCLFVKIICVQDDFVKGWQRIWGKRLFETTIGGLMGKLKKLPNAVVVERWFASTQTCHRCAQKTPHSLKERVFVCGCCGHTEDRDVHAAKNIEEKGWKERIGGEPTESSQEPRGRACEPTPVDIKTTALMVEFLNRIPHIRASLVAETGSLLDKDVP